MVWELSTSYIFIYIHHCVFRCSLAVHVDVVFSFLSIIQTGFWFQQNGGAPTEFLVFGPPELRPLPFCWLLYSTHRKRNRWLYVTAVLGNSRGCIWGTFGTDFLFCKKRNGRKRMQSCRVDAMWNSLHTIVCMYISFRYCINICIYL